jgi:hypothetical protein
MKKLILLVLASSLLFGCAGATRVVTPLAPSNDTHNSEYRKTVEVLLIHCIERPTGRFIYVGNPRNAYSTNPKNHIPETETISVIETTKTGERFEMSGCFGKPNDRFRITY